MSPRKGQRYRSTAEVEVGGEVHLAAPASYYFRARLPLGEVVTVQSDPRPHQTTVFVRPDRYEELEPMLVPEMHRLNAWKRPAPEYGGYTLVIDLSELAEHFEAMGEVGTQV
jgi:hypothetical protein